MSKTFLRELIVCLLSYISSFFSKFLLKVLLKAKDRGSEA